MQAGDVLLFHRPSTLRTFLADPKGTLFTALIHLTTRSRWNHTALAVSADAYVEATAAGVCTTLAGTSSDEVLVVPVPYVDEDDRADAVAWALARSGVRYGYLNAVVCGLQNLLAGRLVIKMGDSIICSELVAESLERAGFDFGKDSTTMSPGDVAEALGARRA